MGVAEQATVKERTKGQPRGYAGKKFPGWGWPVQRPWGGSVPGKHEEALEAGTVLWRRAEQGEAQPESLELRSLGTREPLGDL